MNRTVALILTFVAATLAGVAASDPSWMPTWAQVLVGALSAGFAAIGIPATVGPATTTRRRDVP